MNLQENIQRIKQVMGLISEQAGGLVPNNVYSAISDIESTFSYTDDTGKIIGQPLNGKEVDGQISSYIQGTIGLNYWSKIGPYLRGMIYQYMYQHDSGKNGMRMWWIAGLAQAINSNTQRSSISSKPLTDPNVQNAIKLIKSTIDSGNIDSYYDNYKKVLDNQYSVTSSANSNNYKNVWKYRPTAFERLMKGEDWDTIKKDWMSSVYGKLSSSSTKDNRITLGGRDYKDLRNNLLSKTRNISIDPNSIEVDMDNFEVSYSSGDTKIQVISLIYDDRGQLENRLPGIKSQNPSMREIKKGKNGNIEWVVITI